jgi:hypothetical protein
VSKEAPSNAAKHTVRLTVRRRLPHAPTMTTLKAQVGGRGCKNAGIIPLWVGQQDRHTTLGPDTREIDLSRGTMPRLAILGHTVNLRPEGIRKCRERG